MRIHDLDNTLGIDRSQLPQINSKRVDEIIAEMKNDGIEVKLGVAPAAKLKPTQDKIRLDKVQGMINAGKHKDNRKIFVSKDGYILDGHHHWAANLHDNPDSKIGVIVVGLNVIDAINWLNASPIATNKEITEGREA